MNKSDERTRELIKKQNEIDIANFDPHKEVEYLPYEEKNLLFEQIDHRIRWKSRGDRYYSRRFFPNEQCAIDTMEVLKGLIE